MLLVAAACTSADRASVQRTPCEQMCRRLAACGALESGRDEPTCARDCTNDPRRPIAGCAVAMDAYARCLAPLECDVVHATWNDPGASTSPCAAEFAALYACDPSDAPDDAPKILFQF